MALSPKDNNNLEMYLKIEELQGEIATHYQRLQGLKELHYSFAEVAEEGISLQEKWEELNAKKITGQASAMKLHGEKSRIQQLMQFGSQERVHEEIIEELKAIAEKQQFQQGLGRTLNKLLLSS